MNIIEVSDVSMRFNLATENITSLKEYIIKLAKNQLLFQEFYALRNVTLEVRKGEAFGIIGANGSGKSTLLKVISGIYPPFQGTTTVYGSIAPLIELGAGFDGELTGRENVFLNGSVMGFSSKFMREKYDAIVDFSELADFMDVPIKNYSSGMVARLAFSVATLVQPDILICDEVLAVGDMKFQKKCEQKMHIMMDNGTTLLFVSHSIDQVKALCSRAVFLEKGMVKMIGATDEVCSCYVQALN